MPKETVQYPRTEHGANATEISVHWSRDSFVQLQVERHAFHVKDDCGCNVNPCAHGDTWNGPVEGDGHLPRTKIDAEDASPGSDDALTSSEVAELATAIRKAFAQLEDCDDYAAVVAVITDFADNHTRKAVSETDSDTAVDQWGVPCDHGVQVFTDVLNRTEINNMIRVLRRARDQAYGRDE